MHYKAVLKVVTDINAECRKHGVKPSQVGVPELSNLEIETAKITRHFKLIAANREETSPDMGSMDDLAAIAAAAPLLTEKVYPNIRPYAELTFFTFMCR